jgi:hypothetical protein
VRFGRSSLPPGWWQIDAWIAIKEAARNQIEFRRQALLAGNSWPGRASQLKRMPQNELDIRDRGVPHRSPSSERFKLTADSALNRATKYDLDRLLPDPARNPCLSSRAYPVLAVLRSVVNLVNLGSRT